MKLNTVNLTYEQTLADEVAKERARKLRHYPSGACGYLKSGRFTGKCRRATWFEWNGATKTDPVDAPALFKMRVGDLIHQHMSSMLQRALVERYGVSVFGDILTDGEPTFYVGSVEVTDVEHTLSRDVRGEAEAEGQEGLTFEMRIRRPGDDLVGSSQEREGVEGLWWSVMSDWSPAWNGSLGGHVSSAYRLLPDASSGAIRHGGFGVEVPLLWQPEGFKYPFSGRLDGRYLVDGSNLGVEWKSIYGSGTDAVKRNGPKEDALLQVAIYLEQDVFPIDEVALMYATRDSGYLLGFAVTKGSDGMLEFETMGSSLHTVSEVSWDGVKAATLELEAALEDEAMPPPRDYGPQNPDKSNKWRCSFCSYAKLCEGL